jgi:segregation and condensation protein B
MDMEQLQKILEAALLAAGRPLDLDEMLALFPEQERPDRATLREALAALKERYATHAVELREVASGWRVQIRSDYAPWVSRLWEERTPRYSRALLETLAIIAYRQPITRAEIEDIRGVSLSTTIFRTLLDRRWIRAVGHRDVPGRPALYGTTREFLVYFGLKSLDELPPLAELRDVDELTVALELGLTEPGAEAERPPATVTDLRSYRGGEREATAETAEAEAAAADTEAAAETAETEETAETAEADGDAEPR